MQADLTMRSARLDQPQTLNRYPYANGDPVQWLDPTGLDIMGPQEASPIPPTSYTPDGTPVFVDDGPVGDPGGPDPSSYIPDADAPDGTAIDSSPYDYIPAGYTIYDGNTASSGSKNPKPAPSPCDRTNYKNNEYITFIQAHLADATALAAAMKVLPAELLGLSAAETGFGTSRIAVQDFNFFNLHNPTRTGPFPTQTGVDKGPPGTSFANYMAVFSSADGFLESGEAFEYRYSSLISGQTAPTTFATTLHQSGMGIGTPNYVNDIVSMIQDMSLRINCVH